MSVGPSVGPSIRVSFFGITGGFCITAPAQMLGLAFFITAPAHPHATSVAVHPAFFFFLVTVTLVCRSVRWSIGPLVRWSFGPSVRRSVSFLNCKQFLHYCPCPTVRDAGAVYPALFLEDHRILLFFTNNSGLKFFLRKIKA